MEGLSDFIGFWIRPVETAGFVPLIAPNYKGDYSLAIYMSSLTDIVLFHSPMHKDMH